ncbi:hypothetical protein FOL47_008781 [Perkinsus chesapeaki]|uniref:Uncharacterized protein n=2 Tax=Alveolata TaxID=33630 RepID=A0A7J6MV01_PERCH|nr:hypothetical protein FOL47_008781 [Perkinsus chesapeaki]
MLPIPSRTTAASLSTNSQKISSTVFLDHCNGTEAGRPHACPSLSIPACASAFSENTIFDDETALDTRIIKAMYNAEFNKRNTAATCHSPSVKSDNGSDSTTETWSDSVPASGKRTKSVYFNEQVEFNFPNSVQVQRGGVGDGLEDLRLVSDVKCFDGRSIYSLAGGCPGLWKDASHASIRKMVRWMTTSGVDVPSHRERARSYYSADDMAKDGYLC